MTSNKAAGGVHLLLINDKNELLSTSLRNNTTQKIKIPSSIVPKDVSFVTANRNRAIVISKSKIPEIPSNSLEVKNSKNISAKSSVAILDILQSKIIRKIDDVFSQIRDFACTPINEQLACAVGYTSTVKLLDLVQGKIIHVFEVPQPISCLTFSRDGKSLFLGSVAGNILETDLSNFNTEVYSEVETSGGVSKKMTGYES